MGRIPEQLIQQILERIDLVDLVSRSVALKKTGQNYKGLCPFHVEKTPSFTVHPQKQIFHCFGCGVGGDAIGWLMKHDGLTFPEAIDVLAREARVDVRRGGDAGPSGDTAAMRAVMKAAMNFFHRALLTDPSQEARFARQVLKERGLQKETVLAFRLGWAPAQWDGLYRFLTAKGFDENLLAACGLIIPRPSGQGYYDRFRNRLIFPILDVLGRCVAFGGRALNDDDEVKYINSPETRLYKKGDQWFGLAQSRGAITADEEAVIVEGYMDFLSPYQAGFGRVVAALGTAVTPVQVRLLKRYTQRVVLAFDADAAGIDAMGRSVDLFLEAGFSVRVAPLPEGHDPDSLVREKGRKAFEEVLNRAVDGFDFKCLSLVQRHAPADPAVKAELVDRVIGTLKRIPHPIAREDYARRAAYRLKVPVESLLRRFNEAQQGRTRRTVTVDRDGTDGSRATPNDAGVPVIEKEFMQYALQSWERVQEASDRIDEKHFTHMQVIRMWCLLKKGLDQRTPLSPVSWLMQQDPALAGEVCGWTMRAPEWDETRWEGTLARLRLRHLKRLSRELRLEMAYASAQGDEEALRRLTEDFITLTKQLKAADTVVGSPT